MNMEKPKEGEAESQESSKSTGLQEVRVAEGNVSLAQGTWPQW